MRSSISLLALGLVSLGRVFAQDEYQVPLEVDDLKEPIGDPATTPAFAVAISASFPQSEIFGIKLVNGHPTQAVLSVTNNEPAAVQLKYVGGSLWTLAYGGQPAQNIRNLSTIQYNGDILPGQSESFTYSFLTDMHPIDLQLQLAAIVSDDKGNFYTIPAFNQTVSVVEAPMSILDPQNIFLYLLLAGLFAGTAYFIYNTWFTTLFGQRKRIPGKGGERAKASSRGSKRVDPADQLPVEGADGPAVTSGARSYDESWIPASHLARPQPKRVRSSGTPGSAKSKARPAA